MSRTKFSITRFVPAVLRNQAEQRLTAREIAQVIMGMYPEAVENKRSRSTARKIPLDSYDAMLQQIVAEIGSQRKRLQAIEPRIKTTEGRPRKYYFTLKSDDEEVPGSNNDDTPDEPESSISIEMAHTVSEADLYPLLSRYLFEELNIYAKRIDERRSSNQRGRGGNRWLFPDLVGMEDLSASWNREVIDCVKEYSDKKSKLWSFEVKLRLNGSNVRESYFQAVSNSSWSNVGYLVASEIEGVSTIDELRMLAGIHGIGVLRLDIDNLTESQILIPARERPGVDWESVNRLAQENSDFLEYVKLIRQFYQTGDPRQSEWS